MSFMKKFAKVGGEDAVVMADSDRYEIRDWISTGNYALNCLISADPYKGFPSGRTLQFAGPNSTGKTYLCLEVIKEAQKQGYGVVYIDTEFAQDKESLAARGIDLNTLLYIPIQTVENARHRILNIINEIENEKVLIVVDSIGNLSTNKEVGDMEAGETKRDMTRAQLLRGMFRAILVPAGIKHVPFIVLNHVYGAVGAYFPTNVPSGGGGSLFGSSSIIELSKSKDKEGTDVIGAIIKCKALKNRLAKENKIVKLNINYHEGIDKYSGLEELLDAAEFFAKKGNRNYIPLEQAFKLENFDIKPSLMLELIDAKLFEFEKKVMIPQEKDDESEPQIDWGASTMQARWKDKEKTDPVTFTKKKFYIPALYEFALATGFADWLRETFAYHTESDDIAENLEAQLLEEENDLDAD
jgi:RecA/RadA recombinase